MARSKQVQAVEMDKAVQVEGCIGKHDFINGVYQPLQSLHFDRPCWVLRSERSLYLFHTGKRRWVIGRRLDDGAHCYTYIKDDTQGRDPASCSGPWMGHTPSGKWCADYGITCRIVEAPKDFLAGVRRSAYEELRKLRLVSTVHIKQLWRRLDKAGSGIVRLVELDRLVQDMAAKRAWPSWFGNKQARMMAYANTLVLDEDDDDWVEQADFHAMLLGVYWFCKLWQLFDLAETADDSRLRFREFLSGMEKLDPDLSREDLNHEFGKIDADADAGGGVLFSDVCAYLCQRVTCDINAYFDAEIFSPAAVTSLVRQKLGEVAPRVLSTNRKCLRDFDELEARILWIVRDSARLKKLWTRISYTGGSHVPLPDCELRLIDEFPLLNYHLATERAYTAVIGIDEQSDHEAVLVPQKKFGAFLCYVLWFNKVLWLFDCDDTDRCRDHCLSLAEFKWCMAICCSGPQSETSAKEAFAKADTEGRDSLTWVQFCTNYARNAMQELVDSEPKVGPGSPESHAATQVRSASPAERATSPAPPTQSPPLLTLRSTGRPAPARRISGYERPLYASSPPGGAAGEARLDNSGGETQHLAEGVDLITRKRGGFRFEYSVANNKLAPLDFKITLGPGTVNMAWDGAKEDQLEMKAEVRARSRALVGTVGKVNRLEGAKLDLQTSWVPKEVNKEEVRKASAPDESERRERADKLRQQRILASELGSAKAVMDACKRAGISKFIDVEFYPDDNALYTNASRSDGPPVIWRRIQHPTLFSDGISPLDVQQGALGDCWFLAALAAVAEFPELIKEIFAESSYNEYGVYEISCFKNGLQTQVIIDDLFPCDPTTGEPCYSHTKTNELWVILLEKAWAKLHGSYEQLESGMPHQAIMDLCGGPSKYINLQREWTPNLFETLCKWDNCGYIMCAGTPGVDDMTKSKARRPKGGIVPGHAYTLLSAKQKGDIKLVKLRNPWGTYEWQGDWSDESDLWTPEMKAYFKPDGDAEDGTFWMCEDDFRQHFVDLGVVCERHQPFRLPWAEARTQVTLTASDVVETVVEFHVDVPAAGFVSLLQVDSRINGSKPYVPLAFAIYGPCDANRMPNKEVLRSECLAMRELAVEVEEKAPLEPGSYVVVVFNKVKSSETSVTVVVQLDEASANGNSAMSVPAHTRTMRPDLLERLAIVSATTSAKAEKGTMGPFETAEAWLPHLGYVVAMSNTRDNAEHIDITFEAHQGLTMVGSKCEKKSVKLEPHKMQLIARYAPVPASRSFSFGGFRVSYRRS